MSAQGPSASPTAPAPLRGAVASWVAGCAGLAGSLLFLAPLALIFDLAGYLPPWLRLYLVYVLVAVPLLWVPGRAALRGAGVLAAVAVVISVFRLPPPAEVLLLVFLHLWTWSLTGQLTGALRQGLVFYAVLHLCLFASPLGYPVLEAAAAAVRSVNRWITGHRFEAGYTYTNVGSLLLFLGLSVHGWDRSAVSRLRTAAFVAVALLFNALAAALFLYTVDVDPDLTWELQFRDPYTLRELAAQLANLPLLVYPSLVFAGHALVYLFLHHDGRGPSPAPAPATGPSSPWPGRGFAALAAAVLALAVPPTVGRSPTPPRLVFLEKGVVSFSKPDYERFGRAAGGMYGMFPEYARLFGCAVEVVPEVPADLGPGQVLVVTNLDEPLPPEDRERIWSCVRAGGGLWVLGDHTFIKNGRNHLNDLLAPCRVAFNHDSAQFWPQGWFHSYRVRQGTPFGALTDPAENRLSILVGASLRLGGAARPLVIGRFGYGDWGVTEDDADRGYLGDFAYQPTERCGDLVLVAGEAVGRGRVLVFGDTTSFFNANLSRSHEILRASLSWLGEPPAYAALAGRGALAALLAGLALLLGLSVPVRGRLPPLLLPVLAAAFAGLLRPGLLPVDTAVARERLAVIDFAHQPYAAKHGSLGDSLYGLSLNLLRYGMLPVTLNHWDPAFADDARLLVFNAPRRRFSARRRDALLQYMERGGTVLLACGAPHAPAARPLLDPLGLDVRRVPLGRFFDRPAFGVPVQYFSAWPIAVARPDVDALSVYGDWPLMVEVAVGEGRLVLVGDSEFFLSKNIESHEQYSRNNVTFIRNLLDHVTGAERPAGEPAP